MNPAQHDVYAAEYDAQVRAYNCHITDLVFGLCYEFIRPGQSLLDIGTGSGLAAQLFAKAGLQVSGMDFSPAMLETCRAKGFFVDLPQHDLTVIPWPFPAAHFDHLVACGVFHFIPELAVIVEEAAHLLRPGGIFTFTTRFPTAGLPGETYARHLAGGFEIFSHYPAFLENLLKACSFSRLKLQKCFVGEEIFLIWVVQKSQQS